MVGVYAIGDPVEPIRTDLDKELEGSQTKSTVPNLPWFNLFLDARWFTRDEVLAVLQHEEGTSFTKNDYKQMASIEERVNVKVSVSDPLGGDAAVNDSQTQEASDLVVPNSIEPPFRVPARVAIAGVLISDWAFGRIPAQVGPEGRM
jgi:NAD+ diphosphatase